MTKGWRITALQQALHGEKLFTMISFIQTDDHGQLRSPKKGPPSSQFSPKRSRIVLFKIIPLILSNVCIRLQLGNARKTVKNEQVRNGLRPECKNDVDSIGRTLQQRGKRGDRGETDEKGVDRDDDPKGITLR